MINEGLIKEILRGAVEERYKEIYGKEVNEEYKDKVKNKLEENFYIGFMEGALFMSEINKRV